jgi:hypothetical protein
VIAMKARGAAVPIPTDVVVRQGFSRPTPGDRQGAADVAADDLILDIGPQTARAGRQLMAAGTIVWNGPVGVFEFDAFAHGTETIARAIARRARSASPAAATRWRRSPSTASRKTSATSRPAAAPSSKCSRARPAGVRDPRARALMKRDPRNNNAHGTPIIAANNIPETAMPRATKIVATLGPASSDPEVLERMIRAGVDVVRLNFSHGKAQDHIDRAALVRESPSGRPRGRDHGRPAGPEDPRRQVRRRQVMLEPGRAFVLDAARSEPRRQRRASASTTRSCRATSRPATRCCSTTA